MIVRRITKKAYKETAGTVSNDTDSKITHTAEGKVVTKLGEKN